MSAVSDLDHAPPTTDVLWKRAAAVAAIAGGLNTLLAGGLREAFDTAPEFMPLSVGSVAVLTIVGVLVGAGVLQLLGARVDRPRARWRWIAWIGVFVSVVPNIVFAMSPDAAAPGTPLAGGTPLDWLGLATLHFVAAVVAIPALVRTPPPDGG